MKKPYAKDRILARVAELGGVWPPAKQLAEEFGCSALTVKKARQDYERQEEEKRVKGLKNPCPYCQSHEQTEGIRACDECSQFLTDCFGLAQMTLFLKKNVHHQLEPEALNRARMALAAIIEEWVTERARIEVWGDQMAERWNNSWFYQGNGAGTAEYDDMDDDDADEGDD
jgi:hypothetical protein